MNDLEGIGVMLQKLRGYWSYINKAILVIYVIFFLYFLIEDSLGVMVPLFFEERNIRIVLYGTLLSFTKIVRAIIVVPISMQSVKNKMRCLKVTLLLDIFILIVLMNVKSTIVVFSGFSILFITTSIINVILNPLLGTKADKDHIGIIFGIRDAFLYAGCFLGLVIIGAIKTVSGNTNVVWIFYGCILGVIFFSACILEKNVLNEKAIHSETGHKEEEKTKIAGISKDLAYYLVILFILGVGGACVSFVPLAATDAGLKVNNIFYIFSTSTLFSALLSITGGITIDRFNKKFLFQADIVLFVLILLMYSSGNRWILMIAIMISGISTALDNASNIYVFTNYSEKEVNRFWGIIGSINLISFSIGTFLCGIIYEINYRFLFLFGIVLNVIGLFMSLKLKNIEKNKVHIMKDIPENR